MSAHAIAEKFRKALRKGTGATFTLEQLQAMARWGMLVDLARIEADELCPSPEAPTSELPPVAAPAPAPTRSGLPRERAPLSIELLSKGIDDIPRRTKRP